jgi:uncharacterized membrane protein
MVDTPYSIDLIQIKHARHCCPRRRRGLSFACYRRAGQFMIVLRPASTELPRATMWLMPNRTLSRRGLRRVIVMLVVLVLGTAGLGAWQGNVFAPLFAGLESIVMAYALSVAWRAGDRGERVALDASSVEVQSLPGRRCTRFPAYWVRVLLEPGDGRHRLLLATHGQALEIGVFLAEAERAALSKKLMVLLAESHDQLHK